MANERHARLIYLQQVLQSLDMLLFVAARCPTEECNAFADELEPIVRDLAAKIEAHVSKLVFPRTPDPLDRSDEVVEIELADIRKNFDRINRIGKAGTGTDVGKSTASIVREQIRRALGGRGSATDFAAEADELRRLRSGELFS
jgi:hypothetical protein